MCPSPTDLSERGLPCVGGPLDGTRLQVGPAPRHWVLVTTTPAGLDGRPRVVHEVMPSEARLGDRLLSMLGRDGARATVECVAGWYAPGPPLFPGGERPALRWLDPRAAGAAGAGSTFALLGLTVVALVEAAVRYGLWGWLHPALVAVLGDLREEWAGADDAVVRRIDAAVWRLPTALGGRGGGDAAAAESPPAAADDLDAAPEGPLLAPEPSDDGDVLDLWDDLGWFDGSPDSDPDARE